jgi:hypothetical protein
LSFNFSYFQDRSSSDNSVEFSSETAPETVSVDTSTSADYKTNKKNKKLTCKSQKKQEQPSKKSSFSSSSPQPSDQHHQRNPSSATVLSDLDRIRFFVRANLNLPEIIRDKKQKQKQKKSEKAAAASSGKQNSDSSQTSNSNKQADAEVDSSRKTFRMTAQMASFLKLTLVGNGGVGKVNSVTSAFVLFTFVIQFYLRIRFYVIL